MKKYLILSILVLMGFVSYAQIINHKLPIDSIVIKITSYNTTKPLYDRRTYFDYYFYYQYGENGNGLKVFKSAKEIAKICDLVNSAKEVDYISKETLSIITMEQPLNWIDDIYVVAKIEIFAEHKCINFFSDKIFFDSNKKRYYLPQGLLNEFDSLMNINPKKKDGFNH